MKANKLEILQKTVAFYKNLQCQARSVLNTVKLGKGLKYLRLKVLLGL